MWIEVPDITRRSRRHGRMIDARWLCQSRVRVCVRARARACAPRSYMPLCTCVTCDYYSNFHDSGRPVGFQRATPIAHRDCLSSEYLLSAPICVNRCLASAHPRSRYASLRRGLPSFPDVFFFSLCRKSAGSHRSS